MGSGLSIDVGERPAAGNGLSLRGRHLLLLDVVCVGLAFVLAFALRLDAPSDAFHSHLTRFAWLLLPLLAIRIGANLYFRLYQRLWRYASVEEMQAIVLATSAGSVLFGLGVLGLGLGGPGWPAYGFPRSIVGIEWLLSMAFLGGVRFSLRTVQAGRWVSGHGPVATGEGTTKRVLIVGAGDAGAAVAKEMHTRPGLAMHPVGFIDDDPMKRGKLVHGVQVLGDRSRLRQLVVQLEVGSVIVAMPTAPGTVIRQIVQECREIGVSVMTLPGIAELISGRVSFSQLRPVQVEDLLRREPAHIDLESIAGFLQGATVMVTGAGGSIGSELCRQIMSFHPSRLLLLGRGENSIYHIHQELLSRRGLRTEDCGLRTPNPEPRTQNPTLRTREPALRTDLVPLIADVRDMPRLKAIMEEHRPSVVFHAAAHKHVPLMEANPSEAIATNIFGTRNLLEVSAQIGVDTFVLVSTDKAVNPTSVMGATKRVAELMLKATASSTGRRYVAVRFGNVLGSRGSVVPLFRQQIQAGGPVTVTHREITRYFMTIPEAAQLIIQAAAMGLGGEIFVLDMGQPIKIYDLALDLIRLSGLEPYKDIDVQITGLRPGEKLYEALFTASEERVSTRNSRIFVSSLQTPDTSCMEEELREMAALLSMGGRAESQLRASLARIVPEFSPAPLDPSLLRVGVKPDHAH